MTHSEPPQLVTGAKPTPLQAALTACQAEADDLRDAIRLMIGRNTLSPWHRVPQSEVDLYLEQIRQLKEKRQNERP